MIRLDFQCFKYLLIMCGLGIVILSIPATQAKNPAQAAAKALQDRTMADMTLTGHLAERPQLMNIEYLECYLGPKDQSSGAPSSLANCAGMSATRTLWNDPLGRYNNYKLETSRHGQNDYVAEFDALMPDKAHRRLSEMDKIMGTHSKHSFDEQGQPVDVYDGSPNTKLFVYQAPQLADIIKIRVSYSGPILELPSQSDMQEATQYRRDMAAKQQKSGNYQQAAILWQAHLRSHPDDVDAHLQLAECYKAQCHLNESINEYRIALNMSGNNEDLHKRCVDGLHSLKVDVPASSPSPPPANAGANTESGLSEPRPYVNLAPTTAAPANINNQHPANADDVGF